ncbi:MAG TPA: Uma2 family endonuclease [Thermodesulfobacteriota bacterium]|nr:Uma2 family endonuclease [Thermodesulfobacteriota bacterium]
MREQAFKIDEKFTYQDYLHLPDNGKRYQVINGELYVVPAPVPYHQRVLARVFKIVDSFVSHENLGAVFLSPCDVILSDTDIVQPDLFFVGQDRLDIIKERNIQGAPDLVVEVLSPHSEKIDKISKTKLYARFGVKEYWIVSLDNREVTVLRLRGRKL